MLFSSEIEEFKSVLEDTLSVSKWVFDVSEGTHVNLFTSRNLLIGYDVRNQQFYIDSAGQGHKQFFNNFHALLSTISNLNRAELIVQGYDFTLYLSKLSETISSLEADYPGRSGIGEAETSQYN